MAADGDPLAPAYHRRQEWIYRLLAPFYDRFVEPHTTPVTAAGIALLGDIAGCRILDVGTGTGNLAAGLARAGAQVVGIDLSPSLLRVASRKLVPLGVSLRAMDAAQLAFADDAFDYACSAMVLHEMPGPARDRALAEMARVARRGLLIIDYRRGHSLHWGTRLVERLERSAAESYVHYGLEQRLTALGLSVAARREHGQFEAVLALRYPVAGRG